jgi:hypothetical protein
LSLTCSFPIPQGTIKLDPGGFQLNPKRVCLGRAGWHRVERGIFELGSQGGDPRLARCDPSLGFFHRPLGGPARRLGALPAVLGPAGLLTLVHPAKALFF